MHKLFIFISIFLFLFQYLFGNIDSTLIDSAKQLNNDGYNFYQTGDFYNAEKSLRASLNLKKLIYKDSTSISIAHTYNNLGVINMRYWQYESALDLYKQAEEIYRHFKSTDLYIANVFSNRGNVYSLQGDFELSEQYYNYALNYLKKMFTPKANLFKAETFNRIGLLKMKQNRYKEAINEFRNGIKSFDHSNNLVLVLYLYSNLGDSYASINDFDSAIKYYHEALNLIHSSKKTNKTQEIWLQQKLALLYMKINDETKAFTTIRKSKTLIKPLSIDSVFFQGFYTDYAEIHNKFHIYDSALYYHHLALNITCFGSVKNKYKTPPLENFKNITLGISQLKSKAECLIKWNNVKPEKRKLLSALESLEVATQLIDKARNSYLSVESKLMIAENETSIYEMGLHCASQLFNNTGEPKFLDKAFYFSEKSKSSVLLSVLQDEKAKSFSTIPDTLLKKEQSLKKEIAFYKERIYEESLKPSPDSNKLRIWNGYLFSHTKDQNELQNLLEKEYNDYYFLKYNQQNTTPEEIQKILPKNTTIIEYSLTDTNLYIFCIQTKCLNLKRIKIDSSFLIHTNKYLNQFRDFSFVNQSKTVYRDLNKSGHELYKKLIGPLQDEIANDHLIIIPDDLLSYIPFESLMTREDSMNIDSYKQLPFLIKKHPVSYSYSSSLLNESWASKGRKMHNRLLSIAPDYKPVNTESLIITKASHKGYRDNLHPIPYARKEAELVSSLTLGRSLIGIQATEKAFLSNAVNYDILHLAMHTIIDDNNPLYSKLVFYDENYRSDEGLLTTNEIFSLKLKARMAVLSSCSSGEGEFKKGEGVLSLARGFFYAGCPSLIMTLWQVDDESGLMLMRLYYKYLIKGYSKPVALQKAKLEYLNTVPNQKKHPFYWSTYICIGNPSPIYFPRRYSYLGGVLIIFLLVLILAIQKKKKTKISLKEPDL